MKSLNSNNQLNKITPPTTWSEVFCVSQNIYIVQFYHSIHHITSLPLSLPSMANSNRVVFVTAAKYADASYCAA